MEQYGGSDSFASPAGGMDFRELDIARGGSGRFLD
jgi:hypothetical protein